MSQEGLHGLGGPEVVVDWSSQLCRGITRSQNGGGLEFISLGVVFWVVFAQDGG